MDKGTLSNYGWIVIVALVMSVMLALATPFGKFVGQGVSAIANGFVNSSEIDEDHIKEQGDEWMEYLQNPSGSNNDKGDDNDTNIVLNEVKNIIPEGARYIRCNKEIMEEDFTCEEEEIFYAGEEFPEPETYDIFKFNGWVYVYNGYWSEMYGTSHKNENLNAWVLTPINNIDFCTKATDYPLDRINGKNVELWYSSTYPDTVSTMSEYFRIPQTTTTIEKFDGQWDYPDGTYSNPPSEIIIPKTITNISNAILESGTNGEYRVEYKYNGTTDDFKNINGYSTCTGTVIYCTDGNICLKCDIVFNDTKACPNCKAACDHNEGTVQHIEVCQPTCQHFYCDHENVDEDGFCQDCPWADGNCLECDDYCEEHDMYWYRQCCKICGKYERY